MQDLAAAAVLRAEGLKDIASAKAAMCLLAAHDSISQAAKMASINAQLAAYAAAASAANARRATANAHYLRFKLQCGV